MPHAGRRRSQRRPRRRHVLQALPENWGVDMATGGKRRERIERQERIKCTVKITVTNAGKLLSVSYLRLQLPVRVYGLVRVYGIGVLQRWMLQSGV